MVITGKTTVHVNGKPVRILSSAFNRALRRGLGFTSPEGSTIVPSKGATWYDVASSVREGKSVQASVSRNRKAG